MAEWTHLFSYRTQKLSIPAATIVGPAPCEDSSLPVPFSDHTIAFFVFMKKMVDREKTVIYYI